MYTMIRHQFQVKKNTEYNIKVDILKSMKFKIFVFIRSVTRFLFEHFYILDYVWIVHDNGFWNDETISIGR